MVPGRRAEDRRLFRLLSRLAHAAKSLGRIACKQKLTGLVRAFQPETAYGVGAHVGDATWGLASKLLRMECRCQQRFVLLGRQVDFQFDHLRVPRWWTNRAGRRGTRRTVPPPVPWSLPSDFFRHASCGACRGNIQANALHPGSRELRSIGEDSVLGLAARNRTFRRGAGNRQGFVFGPPKPGVRNWLRPDPR
jgi:hypothetical protein